jgi:hypothetical protein
MHDCAEDFAPSIPLKAIRIGIVAGFFACLAYPLAAFAPLPKLATTTLVACFGPALGIASYGHDGCLSWRRHGFPVPLVHY